MLKGFFQRARDSVWNGALSHEAGKGDAGPEWRLSEPAFILVVLMGTIGPASPNSNTALPRGSQTTPGPRENGAFSSAVTGEAVAAL